MKFVRIIELVTKGYADVFDGVILTENEFEGIFQGPERSSLIKKKTFKKADYRIESSDKERVVKIFDMALLQAEKEVLDKKFELADAEMDLSVCQKHKGLIK